MSLAPLIEVEDLTIEFALRDGTLTAAREVAFSVAPGRTLGLVGESGCGKSVTLRALLGLLPGNGRVTGGVVRWDGERDLLAMTPRELRAIRGSQIAMIFQDPMSTLNPTFSIGDQLVEVLRVKRGMGRRLACEHAVALLDRVGIAAARTRVRDYPHHLSGGMRQRVMIALALAGEPRLLLADEPTTALDVTVQDQILALLAELQQETGMALILVSHDLGVIGQTCDEVAVMYAGRIVEHGSGEEVAQQPRHPYTEGLMLSVPSIVARAERGALPTIGGTPPNLAELPSGCSFAPRCRYAQPACAQVAMELDRAAGEHGSACPLVDVGAVAA